MYHLGLVFLGEIRDELDSVPLGIEEVGEHGSLGQWSVGELHQTVHVGLQEEK